MNRKANLLSAVQLMLSCGALVMGIGAHLSWIDLSVLAFLVAVSVSTRQRWQDSTGTLCAAWLGTLWVWGGVVCGGAWGREPAVALMGLFNGAAFLLPVAGRSEPGRGSWRILGIAWLFMGGFSWLAFGYAQNYSVVFHLGIVVNIALLASCHFLFRMPLAAAQAVNTVILLLVVLPVADLWLRPKFHPDEHPDPRKRSYLYSVAQNDPGGYAAWTRYAGSQWRHMTFRFFIAEPSGPLPYVIRTNCQGRFFDSTVVINSLGFRGKEISRDKGNAYRIVALGESTTFGVTMNPEDRPWPDTLEDLIRDEMRPARPVEVINAGLPGYTLVQNLYRLRQEILPLKPDMVISYHGINGFPWICPALAPPFSEAAPVYHERPLKLLADFEFSLRIAWYRLRQRIELYHRPPYLRDPMDTEYARAYRELIEICRTNGVRLVLANFSMALNSQSDPRVAQFYQAGFPTFYLDVKANGAHSAIVRQLASEHPEVCFVDTHPGLDGVHDEFSDMVHLTEEGRQELARTIFASVRGLLERDLGSGAPAAQKRP